MFAKLLTFSVLISGCLTITLPKSFLMRLCETAQSARKSGLTGEQVKEALRSEFKSYTGLLKTDYTIDIEQTGMMNLFSYWVANPEADMEWDMSMMGSFFDDFFEWLDREDISVNSMIEKYPNIPDKLVALLKPPQSTDGAGADAAVNSNSVKEVISSAVQQFLASVNTDQCSNLDLPESVDLDNPVEVKRTGLRFVLSSLKNRLQNSKIIENLLTALQNKLSA